MLTAVSACWGFVIQILCYVMVGYTDKSVITCRAILPNQMQYHCNVIIVHGYSYMALVITKSFT